MEIIVKRLSQIFSDVHLIVQIISPGMRKKYILPVNAHLVPEKIKLIQLANNLHNHLCQD